MFQILITGTVTGISIRLGHKYETRAEAEHVVATIGRLNGRLSTLREVVPAV